MEESNFIAVTLVSVILLVIAPCSHILLSITHFPVLAALVRVRGTVAHDWVGQHFLFPFSSL